MLSVIGYGFVFVNYFFNKTKDIEISLIGIFGLFIIYLISSFTHILVPHEYIHNFCCYMFRLNNALPKQDESAKKSFFKIIIFMFILLFTGFLITKTNEDFPIIIYRCLFSCL